MAPSRMSSVGKWGRKSFPTKKHRNTKSSMIRSKFLFSNESAHSLTLDLSPFEGKHLLKGTKLNREILPQRRYLEADERLEVGPAVTCRHGLDPTVSL